MKLKKSIAGIFVLTTIGASSVMAQDGNIVATRAFHGAAHQTSGRATVYQTPDGEVLRITHFKTSNGPNVHVLLIAASDAKDDENFLNEKVARIDPGPLNAEVGTPKSVCDLAAHYRLHELTRERKAFSPIENHRLLFKRYIETRWGSRRLGAVRTIEVEEWLHSLPLAPASKAKLKCVMAVLYNHAIRHEWLTSTQSAE